MTAAGIDLVLARREAESEMRETCAITRDGERTWNPVTMQYEDTDVTVYTGKCKLRVAATQVRNGETAGQVFIEQRAILSLPVDASTGVRKDDKVTITASEGDPALPGTVVWIDAARAYTNATSRRFPVRETQ